MLSTVSNRSFIPAGLIKLKRRVVFSQFIRPVCFPLKGNTVLSTYTGGLVFLKKSFPLRIRTSGAQFDNCRMGQNKFFTTNDPREIAQDPSDRGG